MGMGTPAAWCSAPGAVGTGSGAVNPQAVGEQGILPDLTANYVQRFQNAAAAPKLVVLTIGTHRRHVRLDGS
jgi:hypothetical protein